jgi:hypothetical protein
MTFQSIIGFALRGFALRGLTGRLMLSECMYTSWWI